MVSLRISGGDRDINLYPWLNSPETKRMGIEALAGIVGFGLPSVTTRWFEGAGAGSNWRGSKVNPRIISIPLHVSAETREELQDRVSDLAVALDPDLGQSRLSFELADGDIWWLDVVREGGGDWSRKVDSDDNTYFKTTIQLKAGDPFWTRIRPEYFEVRRTGDEAGLLPELAKLQVGSGAAFGVQEVENVGDTRAWPFWTITGPTNRITLIGADGERLVWDDTLAVGDTLFIDARAGTIVDQNGDNRYGALDPAPRFWSIRPKKSVVTVEALNIEDSTSIYCQWWPRRQAAV